MNRQRRTIAVFLSLAMNAVAVAHSADLKFRAVPGPEPVVGHYVVTLADSVAEEFVDISAEALAQAYVGQLEPYRSSQVRQFAITMLPSRARTLSSDPRVREVVEIAQQDYDAGAARTSPSTAASAPSGLARQHLVPGTRDAYSTGTYTYDGAGNITAIGADTYVYDTAQRLVRSVTRGVEEDYTYDAFGNRKSATGAVNCLGQTTCAQTVTVDSSTNHLTAINGAAVTYDDAGNIKTIAATATSPGAVYSYDGAGNMTEAIVGSDVRQFIYTADGERIAVRQGSSWTWMVRDLDGKVLREFTSLEPNGSPGLPTTNRQWAKDYVWRDGLLLATVTPAGTLHYHLDHLGTPRLVTDDNGVKVAEHAYYPFGAEINLTPHETPEEAMKFTGHERDIVAGDGHTLDYMHARFYNPTAGRLTSPDPLRWIDWQDGNRDDREKFRNFIANPQNFNMYAYVGNNPIDRTDPTGMQGCQAGDKKFDTCTITIVYDPKTSNGTLTVTGQNKGDTQATVLLTSSIVVGGDGHVTPIGKFTASVWEKDHVSTKYGANASTPWSKSLVGRNAFGPYQLHIKELEGRGIYIHGTMGPSWSPTTWGNRFLLSPTSHGCVRMCNADMFTLHDIMPNPRGNKIVISNEPEPED